MSSFVADLAAAGRLLQGLLAEPLDVYRAFFLEASASSAASPVDRRHAPRGDAQVPKAIDYDFPAWTQEYTTRDGGRAGDAYSEPAADVRGAIASVR